MTRLLLSHCLSMDCHLKSYRCEQDLNLRGETPLDFESNALTTRPSQQCQKGINFKEVASGFLDFRLSVWAWHSDQNTQLSHEMYIIPFIA